MLRKFPFQNLDVLPFFEHLEFESCFELNGKRLTNAIIFIFEKINFWP